MYIVIQISYINTKDDNILIVFTSIKEKLIDFTEFFKYNGSKGEKQ